MGNGNGMATWVSASFFCMCEFMENTFNEACNNLQLGAKMWQPFALMKVVVRQPLMAMENNVKCSTVL